MVTQMDIIQRFPPASKYSLLIFMNNLLFLIYGSFFLNSLSDLMFMNEHCIRHSTDIILFHVWRSPFQRPKCFTATK